MNIERFKDCSISFAYVTATVLSGGGAAFLIGKNVDMIAQRTFSKMSTSSFVPMLIVNALGMVTCLFLALRLTNIFITRARETYNNGRHAPFSEWGRFSIFV